MPHFRGKHRIAESQNHSGIPFNDISTCFQRIKKPKSELKSQKMRNLGQANVHAEQLLTLEYICVKDLFRISHRHRQNSQPLLICSTYECGFNKI